MGCGSSRVEHSRFRHTYREPSEFDTCSSVVSVVRDPRGEPDGKEISPSSGPKEVLNDYSNRVSNFPPKERLGSMPSRKAAPRNSTSSNVKATNPRRVETSFNELAEPEAAANPDGLGVETDEAKSSNFASSIGDSVDILTAS